MVRPAGLEPATCTLEGCYSIQLNYGRNEALADNFCFLQLTSFTVEDELEIVMVLLV